MIKIAICDNDVALTSLIECLLYKIAQKMSIAIDVDIFFDGITLRKSMEQENSYDLIYLDIEMEKLDGIETARQIREKDYMVLIIYVSSYEEYLKELFEVEPFRFLSKPIDEKLFYKYFQSAYERIEKEQEYFEVKFNNEIVHVPIKNIVYFESEKRYVHVITDKRKYTLYGKLKEIESQMKNRKFVFIRIHQSYLVNYKYIKRINLLSVVLHNGIELRISEDRVKDVRKKFCEIAKGNMSDV